MKLKRKRTANYILMLYFTAYDFLNKFIYICIHIFFKRMKINLYIESLQTKDLKIKFLMHSNKSYPINIW